MPCPSRRLLLAACLLAALGGRAWAQRQAEPIPIPLPDEAGQGGDVVELTASLPPGFVDEAQPYPWEQAVGMTFSPDGHLFVWERGGRLWVIEDDVLQAEPVLDISPEVGSWGDHGMLGVALSPDFGSGGFVYLLYVVDYHHASTFGTPAYDPGVDVPFHDTIARITRYAIVDAADHGIVADPASRHVLLGEDLTKGIPICHHSHGVGSLVFGSDGTLLASVGDGTNPLGGSVSGTCLTDGIIHRKEDVGVFRAQYIDSLSGKVLRLDPATGDGVPSNPFYDVLAPRAPRSRVWALGLRNPFRMTRRPGTGEADPLAGDPGTLVVADVGGGEREEIDVVTAGGANLGWPLYEGLGENDDFIDPPVFNLDAPNPLFGRGGCTQEHLAFADLLVQDTLGVPFWPNPCDELVPIDPATPTFVHRRPIVEYGHGQPAQVPDHDVTGAAISVELGSAGSPVEGDDFDGVCVVGGAFYPGGNFPPGYTNSYFFADYGGSWIRRLTFDPDGTLRGVKTFGEAAGYVVAFAFHPSGESLYYINYADPVEAVLHRIGYFPDDAPPTAVAAADPTWGPGPLAVGFDGTGSSDPEQGALQYAWDFGDGTPPSTEPQPVHVFPAVDLTDEGTIVSRLDELDPPEPMGFGSKDPEVIRDGVLPPLDAVLYKQQFDTIHYDETTLLPDKRGVDWVGYTYPGTRTFHSLLYQEGMQFSDLGGWFGQLTVQVLQGSDWNEVTGLTIWPAYPGDLETTYETFELRFDPIQGQGVRLYGEPAGLVAYVSVGELRVAGAPSPPLTLPTNYDVTLTVTDAANNADEAALTVSANNSPPSVGILEPANGSTYPFDQTTTVALEGAAADLEHGPGTLTCQWEVILHHDEHIHPEPPDPQCSSQATFAPHGQDGDVYWYEVRYTATDPLGLAGKVSHFVLPSNDQNLNGVDDADDVALGLVPDTNGDGIPDDVQTDCDGNGLPDVVDLFLGLAADRNANGVPDPCEGLKADVEPTAGPPVPIPPF